MEMEGSNGQRKEQPDCQEKTPVHRPGDHLDVGGG